MKTFKLARTAVAALALCSGLAQAAIVTEWKITDNAVFLPGSVQPVGSAPNPVLSNGNQTLTWGTPADDTDPSSLAINNSGNPFTVNTGVLANTISITHNNFPILSQGVSLTSVSILATLTLQGIAPAGPLVGPVTQTFGIDFLETPNAGTGGVCADGAAVGSGGININGCADIFVIDQESLNFPFLYEGNPYFLSVFANGLGTLSDAACTAVLGAGNNGCRGFETIEGDDTTAIFKVLITSTPFQVPEPGSLALLGGALAALALAGRRRKQQQD